MTLVRTVAPLPDESLPGLVVRAAGINIYPRAHNVLSQAAIDAFSAASIASRPIETAEALAEVLGTTPELIRRLYHPPVDNRRIDFFGVPLRAVHREVKLRRLSPRALRDRAYIRAIWSVRPLAFDPDTRETLLSNCPVCGRNLGFTRTWRIECCEHCVGTDGDGLPQSMVDLRDFPQPLVEVLDEEGLAYVVSLIDPRKATADLAVPHADLTGFGRGELFDFALALGTSMKEGVLDGSFRADSGIRVTDVPADALAKAGRILLSWPRELDSLCSEVAAKAKSRDGNWGYFKAFGPLAVFSKDPHLSLRVRRVLADRMEKVMGDLPPDPAVPRKTTRRWAPGVYVGMAELRRTKHVGQRALTRLGNHPEVLKYRADSASIGTVTFSSFEADLVLRHYKDLESESSICTALGLPPDGVRDLAEVYFPPDTGQARKIASELSVSRDIYSKQFTREFLDIVANGLPFQRVPPKGYVKFMEAMLMFPSGRRPWLPVIKTIIYGHAKAVFRQNVADKPKVKGLFGHVSLTSLEQHRERINSEHREAVDHDIGRISAVSANLMLGIYNHYVFSECAKEGLLGTDDRGWVAYRQVLEFSRKYILMNEAAVRSRNSAWALKGWLGARGIRPLYEFGDKGGVIYDRERVEPYLLMKA